MSGTEFNDLLPILPLLGAVIAGTSSEASNVAPRPWRHYGPPVYFVGFLLVVLLLVVVGAVLLVVKLAKR